MSQLDDTIDKIRDEQYARGRLLLEVSDDMDEVDVDDISGFDFVLSRRESRDAVVVRVWWSGNIMADVQAYIGGDLINAEVWELDGTTSVMASRP